MISIRPLIPTDWEGVRRIYLEGIATRQATFETEAPAWEQWDANHQPFGRLVVTAEDEIRGWAALSKVSTRQVYSGVAEVSVYVAAASRGQGLGGALLQRLIEEGEKNGIWTFQASIFPENTTSIELHRRCGFHLIGRRERIAKLNGVWRDTVLLERRSKVIGTD